MRVLVATLAALLVCGAVVASEPSGLVGRVVCRDCWEAAERERATSCTEPHDTALLVVRRDDVDGGFDSVLLEGKHDWRAELGRFARVSGMVHDHDGRRALLAADVERLDASAWADPSAFDALIAGGEQAGARLAWTDLLGSTRALDDFRDRIVVLNFWATWCAPCVKELPDLAKIQREYGLWGVQVLAASADPVDAVDRVTDFSRPKRLGFPVVLGATTEQMRALGLGPALPATVVIDRDGHVVERIEGIFERRELEAALDGLLTGTHVAHADHDHSGHRHAKFPRPATEAALVPS